MKKKREPVVFELGNGFSWVCEEVGNGFGGNRVRSGYLIREDDPDFRRCVIDGSGWIQNFPGFAEDTWHRGMEFPIEHRVRFAFWVSRFEDGKASVRWTLQPDGRYFEDEDGYGAEHCEEVVLYSHLDENGLFTEPFHRW